MICPMTFSNPEIFSHGAMKCNPDCAWRIKDTHGNYGCAVSALAIDTRRTQLKAANFEKLRSKRGE